ncbi:hypothetical protein NDU88_005248 [Pleurodeles waltl]|uniref:Uncharacterized protein n=1 Tax=Pleurodeles waltl TaxID=8319 RepID=A0AAV7WAZ1_PLEWA|nr:hypothetical protein NDU88_005248 [Pleurodeles waltl]
MTTRGEAWCCMSSQGSNKVVKMESPHRAGVNGKALCRERQCIGAAPEVAGVEGEADPGSMEAHVSNNSVAGPAAAE